MKTHRCLLLVLLLPAFSVLSGAEIFVAGNGNDQATGTIAAPLRTIRRGYEQARPGDTIFLREGVYREAVSLKNTSGTDASPVTLTAYRREKATISGLDVLTLDWSATSQQGVYSAPFDTKFIAQLFFNGKPLLEARWPNVPKDANGDWNFFSPEIWASADTSSNSYGTLVCAALAKTRWNVTGAQALLNVDHQFFCWTRPVRTHSVGSSAFTYDQNLGKSVNKRDEAGVQGKWNERNKFYLFGLRQFLDAPGEWFYDSAAKRLFICSLEGKSPAGGVLEIKTRAWGFTADHTCSYLTIDGVSFFGTAFKFGGNPNKRSSHIVLRNSSIFYSSWTEYLSLEGAGLPEQNNPEVAADTVFPTIMADHSQVVNSTFGYGALTALLIHGLSNRIENNLFHDFDYSSSLVYPPLQINKPGDGFEGKAGHAVISYNTICRSGGIQARMAQADCEFTMNDVHDSYLACYGGNKDTSAVYTQRPSCVGTRFHHNWVHEGYSGTPPLPWGGGMGIRGDDLTCGLTVDHNVVWNCGSVGIFIKNVDNPTPDQANRCVNNTVFDHSAHNAIKSAIVIPTVPGKSKKPEMPTAAAGQVVGENPNAWSTVANNLADSIYGQWNAHPLGKVKLFTNNATSFNASTDLVNKGWGDFRPAAGASAIINHGVAIDGIADRAVGGAADIGAYERGDSVYWIPGRRETQASFPIVPDGEHDVPLDRDVLMWRAAYNAAAHRLMFGSNREAVNSADARSPAVLGEFEGEDNVFRLPKLSGGQKYWWRVDAVMPDGSVIQGALWNFTTAAGK